MAGKRSPVSRAAKARKAAAPAAPLRFAPDIVALTAVLQAHALGEHEMSASQVNVALSLLKIFSGKAESESDTAAAHEDALLALS